MEERINPISLSQHSLGRFKIFSNDQLKVMLTPNGNIYYFHCGYTKNKLLLRYANWHRIELAHNLEALDIALSTDYCYIHVKNSNTSLREIWHANIAEHLSKPLSSITIFPQQVYFPKNVDITKIIIARHNIFALTESGKLYSWCEKKLTNSYNINTLGRIPSNNYDYCIPGLISLPDSFQCIDLLSTPYDTVFALSKASTLCSWGVGQNQNSAEMGLKKLQVEPKIIELPSGVGIDSLTQISVAANRTYLNSLNGSIVCLGEALSNRVPSSTCFWLNKVEFPFPQRIKKIYAFRSATFFATESNECYWWGKFGYNDYDCSATQPTKIKDIEGEIKHIITTDKEDAILFGAAIIITSENVYCAGYHLSNYDDSMPEEYSQKSYLYYSDRNTCSTSRLLTFTKKYIIDTYDANRKENTLDIVIAMRNTNESILCRINFPSPNKIDLQKTCTQKISVSWIRLPQNTLITKILHHETTWAITDIGSVYNWIVKENLNLLKLPIDCQIEELSFDRIEVLLSGRNKNLRPVLFSLQKEISLRERSDEFHLCEMIFPLIVCSDYMSDNTKEGNIIKIAKKMYEFLMASYHYKKRNINEELLMPILSLAKGNTHAVDNIEIDQLLRSIPSNEFFEHSLKDLYQSLMSAFNNDDNSQVLVYDSSEGISRASPSPLFPKDVWLIISRFLDGYSTLALSQVSRLFCEILTPLIAQRMNFQIKKYSDNYILQAPDDSLYYGKSERAYRDKNTIISWQRIILPRNLNIMSLDIIHNRVYILANNQQSLRNEIWQCPIEGLYAGLLRSLANVAIPIGFPEAVNITKLTASDECNFALTHNGLLYSWSSKPDISSPLLGRIVGSPEESTNPGLVLFPNRVMVKDIVISHNSVVWALTDAQALYLWSSKNPGLKLPTLVNLPDGNTIASFNQLTFAINRTYFRNTTGSLYCIDHNLGRSFSVILSKKPIIHKLIARPNSTFIITRHAECFAYGNNQYGILGIDEIHDKVTVPTKINFTKSEIYDVIGVEDELSLNNLTLFVAKYGIFYCGVWINKDAKASPTPTFIPNFPKGVTLIKYSVNKAPRHLHIAALIKFKNQSALFYCQISHSTDNTQAFKYNYTSKETPFQAPETITKISIKKLIYCVTDNCSNYCWNIKNNEITYNAKQVEKSKNVRLSTNRLSIFHNCHNLMPTTIPIITQPNLGYRIKASSVMLSSNRFPLLWNSALHENNLMDHTLIKAAIDFCQCYFAGIKYRDPGEIFHLIKPVLLVANGYVHAKTHINFEKLAETLPQDIITGVSMSQKLAILRSYCIPQDLLSPAPEPQPEPTTVSEPPSVTPHEPILSQSHENQPGNKCSLM